MNIRAIQSGLVSLVCAVLGLTTASATTITWNNPGTFTNDSVLLHGELLYAVATGSASAINNVGPSNITFGADNGVHLSYAAITDTHYALGTGYGIGLAGGGSSGNAGFDAVLNNTEYNGYNSFDNGGNPTNYEALVTLKNLTIGQKYEVQLFVADTRLNGREFSVDGGQPGQYSFLHGSPSLGGYVTGTFTANATQQSFTEAQILVDYHNAISYQFNGLVLDVIPEPSVAALAGMGWLGLILRRRVRRS